MFRLRKTYVEGFTVYHRNQDEFDQLYNEIFLRHTYRLHADVDKPFIIDCGSHIGVSILYFKRYYPHARILGFEPNPDNFEILRKNIYVNKLRNVQVLQRALWDKETTLRLHTSEDRTSPWTWSDTVVDAMWPDEVKHTISVYSVCLSKYITRSVNLLKIDVEGSEQKILQEALPRLHLVKEIVMELHKTSTNLKINDIRYIQNMLKGCGYTLQSSDKGTKIIFFPKIGTFCGYSKKIGMRAWRVAGGH